MRTSCLDAIVPLGAAEPESNPAAYLGGWVRDWRGKKKRFWLPPWNQTVLFNRNIPSSLCTSLIRLSPLAVFVSVNPFTSREKEGRLLLRLDGQKLLAYDVQQLALLADKIEAIQFQISSFVQWFNHSKKRIHAWPRVLEEFRPRTIHGRFTSWQSSPETSLYVSELAILKCFLYFLAKKQGLLTADEVNSILGMYWKLMLPKSVPSGSSESTPLSWDSPATFWRFLNEYISESARSISTEGAPVSGGIVGAFHRLASGESFLIFPRTLLLQAYMGWLSAKGGRTLEQAGRWEAQVQAAILEWGVPLKREGEDISWRFTFYQSHQAPQGLKEKLPCLAFPLDQLPQEIIRSLESSLGAACSRWLPSVGQPEGGDAA